MSIKKTNNSHFKAKVNLRLENLPEKKSTVRILDCFSGTGEIWKAVQKETKTELKVLGIDKKTDYPGVYLKGDNMKYLRSLDLNQFDIIDLDAYGTPIKQLEVIFNRHFKGIIFITFIQTLFGGIPKIMLNCLGYTDNMIKKCPTLFNKNALEKFKQYLFIRGGITEIERFSFDKKHYLKIDTSTKYK